MAIVSQLAPSPVGDAVPSVGRWRVIHGLIAALLVLYVLFHLANHLFVDAAACAFRTWPGL